MRRFAIARHKAAPPAAAYATMESSAAVTRLHARTPAAHVEDENYYHCLLIPNDIPVLRNYSGLK